MTNIHFYFLCQCRLAYDTVKEMEAKGISNTAVVVPLLEQSYRMYKRAIEAEEARGVIPTPHWYKNFGLIHPKLLSLQESGFNSNRLVIFRN